MNAIVEADHKNNNEASASAEMDNLMRTYPVIRTRYQSDPMLFMQVLMSARVLGKDVDKSFTE
jgi:hypothetical protein